MVDELATDTDTAGVERLLRYLHEAHLFDFTGYKRGTLSRRIERRMQTVGVESYDEYIDYLEVHPGEFETLFNTILINVSSFFRDPDAWESLNKIVLPELISRRQGSPIRIWSAGCAMGQEAYSILMLLAESLGVEAVQQDVKIFATDLDNEALELARQAEYSARDVEGVPLDLLEKYFRPTETGYSFTPELRRSVIFGRHDLMQDAPISRTDLLFCRNTLMYFNADVQSQLIHRLHFSTADHGFLMLGRVEMLTQHDLFLTVDQKYRIFRKINSSTLRARLLAMAGSATDGQYRVDEDHVVELAFEQRLNPEILLDAAGIVLAVNAQARHLFAVGIDAVGQPFQDLELSYRPVELRSRMDEVRSEGRVVEIDGISRWAPNGDLTFLDVRLVPLLFESQRLGIVITFIDVTKHRQLQQELEQTHRDLEVAYEELQSGNEELETTNEELQSTNEELETINEELSSTNEELQATNDELQDRTSEINQVNAYIESVLATLEASVIVIDRGMQVRVWNGLSFEMWGLRPEEAEGRNFLALDIGFPVDILTPPIRSCLQDEDPGEPISAEAVTRRGRSVRCCARVAPLYGAGRVIEGAIILINEESAKGY